VPGIQLAARYRPAGRVNAVGGDFYGIWPDERGAWRIVVGDVTGKGATEATMTGLVRHTLHAGTLRGDGIASELTLANDVLLSQPGGGRYCTALYGRLEPPNGGARLQLVSAGHPPPLLRRADGTVAEVPVRGSLLGLERGMRYDPVAVELGAGDLLLLYTDGATELRGLQVPEGDAALRRLLRDHGDGSPTELLEAIEHHALVQSEGSPRDDIALLALRCEP
jgi:serine phosphatase RsbU (regulator of sigma subunit)